jgi:SWIM zinc finger
MIQNWIPESFMVQVDKDKGKFLCNCKGFEFEGFLCQHAIKVMDHMGYEHLPQEYILKRWCKDANIDAKRPVMDRLKELEESEALRAFRRATIRQEWRELEDLAITSNDAFDYVRSIIVDAKNEVIAMVNIEETLMALPPPNIDVQTEQDKEDKGHKYVVDPPLSRCKGRKKRPSRFKPAVEINARQRRTCSYCHNKEAHNIRTCPKVLKLHYLLIFNFS